MTSLSSNHRSPFMLLGALAIVIAALVTMGSGCDSGGEEGNRCNPLVLRDECNSGLHCTPATCTEAYCCPADRSSADPHCNAAGCPAADAGDEGGSDAGHSTIGVDASDANAGDGPG